MLTGLFTLIFLVVILGLGALGVYHGLQDQNREKVRLAQEHYDKALNYIDEGSYGLAIAELEEAIRLNPEFDEAKLKLNEVRVLAEAKPTSTIDAYRDLAARLYQEARNFYDQGAWEQAIGKLEELRTLDAGLNREDAEAMLFDAYYNRGLALVEEGRMAEAVRLFDKALELRPENPDVLGQRNLASLYAAGLGYWQADWPQAIAKFEALYELEPEYRDVRQRLHDAHLYYGDLLAEQGEWCSAQAQYDRALAIIPTEAIAQRRDQAGQACEQGAPPPEAMPGTPPAEATPAEPGTFVGRFIGYQDISDITNKWAPIRGQLIDVNGEGVPGKAVKIQAFDWSATATTDGNGEFGFEFLDKELTFTLTLIDLPHEPVKVATKIGQRAQVEFVEQP
jgi:tetratricopeptide (TPR) repeat protein